LPGLEPRHTEAFFFIKKFGFERFNERLNLCVDLEKISKKTPPKELGNIKIRRATNNDKEELVPISFMPKLYQLSFWPIEIDISFQNKPISTFIALDKNSNKILGWASHSIHFPGSFGPTGVSKNSRGRGIGSLLLNWCLWDLKNCGHTYAKILWVEIDTAYFYSKSIGAYICETYWPMKKRI
ncbi:MAG: GNAT family N-acetyltransferase, partial [Candidatus Lokiarchaeota archaeon]|nr:GNAT family N-acetyltransferase [Candidatus Lokiarchaeota archaeon]MBD3339931.1 GNAT family N-acetyltransferase [Candidatus Lokiarchaeota archaeon]